MSTGNTQGRRILYTRNGRRFNVEAPHRAEDGTLYPHVRDRGAQEKLGVQPVLEPAPPDDYSDALYTRNEIDVEPYVEYVRRSDEHVSAARWSLIRQLRDEKIAGGMLLEGRWVASDERARQRVLELVVLNSRSVFWRTLDGSQMTLNPAQLRRYLEALVEREQSIRALADVKALDGSNPWEGWPQVYADTLPFGGRP